MTKVFFKSSDAKPWTAEELQRLQNIRDEDIDYSDIPPTDPKDWENAIRGKFYRPVKKSVSLRIDADVLNWFKLQGKGYQTRINQTLREASNCTKKRNSFVLLSVSGRSIRSNIFTI